MDTSVDKLRKRYANLKTEWRCITDRVKTGSGLSPVNEPNWYCIINEIWSETNQDLNLTTSGQDTSFSILEGPEEESDVEIDEDNK